MVRFTFVFAAPPSQANVLLATTDMKAQFVFDPLISKRQQYLLATQLVRAILKVRLFAILLSPSRLVLTGCLPFLLLD